MPEHYQSKVLAKNKQKKTTTLNPSRLTILNKFSLKSFYTLRINKPLGFHSANQNLGYKNKLGDLLLLQDKG